MIEHIALAQQGDKSSNVRKEILKEQWELLITRMKEMQKPLDILDHKIEADEQVVLRTEKEMIRTEDQAWDTH